MHELAKRKHGRIAVVAALAVGALAAALAPASAKPLRHRHVHASRQAPAYAYAPRGYAGHYSYGDADNPYNPYAAPGAALRALARQNQNAPGVTNELAPDNIATATGGPSGGVPGFSGH